MPKKILRADASKCLPWAVVDFDAFANWLDTSSSETDFVLLNTNKIMSCSMPAADLLLFNTKTDLFQKVGESVPLAPQGRTGAPKSYQINPRVSKYGPRVIKMPTQSV